MYRTSDESPLVPALIEASENGKQTVCLVEIKARGDERRNIEWSRAMEQAGVHVAYGFPSLKIHAKMTLVVRREGGVLRRYVHLGTGNYNAVTARAYEDFGLFTADEDIAADVADLFNYVTGFGRPAHFRKLLVAPFTLRQRLIDEIREVATAARAGRKARIRIKVNGLTHTEVIDELYAASDAGARIELLVRGVCSLRPGVPGLSENIRVRSVLGRFLEHSRLFCFEAGDRTAYYLGSADMMPRNLDHRVEVVTPVEDLAVQSELAATFDTLLADNTTSWELHGRGHVGAGPDEEGRADTVGAGDDDAPRPAARVAGPRGAVAATVTNFSRLRHRLLTSFGVRLPEPDLPCEDVRIGVVDVGSNTIRLLLAQVEGRELVPLEKERVRLSLGAEIELTGVVSDVSIAAAAKAVGKLCGVARRGGAETLDVFLTAPGRQSANAEHLVDAITRSARHSVRVLSTEEEGRLAYAGAVATADVTLPYEIAVCDVGGASTEIAVGHPSAEPSWVESIDLGSVRLTARVDDPAARGVRKRRTLLRRSSRRRFGLRSRSAAARGLRAGSSARRSARPSWPRRSASSRPSVRRRSRGGTECTARARGSCSPGSCSSPRCRAASVSRCTYATAASARAPCLRPSPSSPPRATRGRADTSASAPRSSASTQRSSSTSSFGTKPSSALGCIRHQRTRFGRPFAST